MGGSMSILNATNLPLDISLNQIGPLYYENQVPPGSTMERKTAAVHFTVTASYSIEGVNKYSDWSVAWPIMAAAGGGIIAVAGAAVAVPAAALGLGAGAALIPAGAIAVTLAEVTLVSGGAAITPGIISNLVQQYKEDLSLSSMGWYAGKNHKLKIVGGWAHKDIMGEDGKMKQILYIKPLTLEYM